MKDKIKKLFKHKEEDVEPILRSKELKKYGLLSKLGRKDLRLLRNLLIKRNFRAGEVLFKLGFPHSVLYFIAEGEILIYLEQGECEIELAHLETHDFFGEVGLFVETTRSACARAEVDTIVLAMTKRDFNAYINQNGKAGEKLLTKISTNLCNSLIATNDRLKKMSEAAGK